MIQWWREEVWEKMKRADQFLDYLLREEGLTLQQALLLLTYRYQSLGRVKRILGYSRTYTQRLNKNFLRNLLLKWADKFFLQKITAFSVMNMLKYQEEMRVGRNINTFSWPISEIFCHRKNSSFFFEFFKFLIFEMKNQTQYKICYILRQTDMYVFFLRKSEKTKKQKV